MPSCILYQSASKIIFLVDIPRSLETAQGFVSENAPRLISSTPLEHPYPTIEPKSKKAKAEAAKVFLSVEELLLQRHLELALNEVKQDEDRLWCLPRVMGDDSSGKMLGMDKCERRQAESADTEEKVPSSQIDGSYKVISESCTHFHNPEKVTLRALFGSGKEEINIPPYSTFLDGEVKDTIEIFNILAPNFDFIIMDPPWQNRSAKRKRAYSLAHRDTEIRLLLSSIPIYNHIRDEGLVAVWVTNRPAFREMLLGEGGLFEEWGVELVEEWIWLKVTRDGQPICALESTWKKPYEVLLVAKRGGNKRKAIERRVIMGVPDLHSRKPSLKALLEHLLSKNADDYRALEIFARNLTAGWWSWGNEVLKFQSSEHWAEP